MEEIDRHARYTNLVLYCLRLELALGEGRHALPAYLGSTIRGIIAASFRDLVCVTQAPAGRAIDYLPYFIYVMQETGKKGLGRVRVPYHLTAVTDGGASHGALIFSAAHGIVHEEVQSITIAALSDPGDAQMDEMTLDFLTPLRIKKFGAYQEDAERPPSRSSRRRPGTGKRHAPAEAATLLQPATPKIAT